MKIISLVPSITETLFDFGLNASEVVGRTKFCIHPKDKASKTSIIGGTKNLHIDKIKLLQPDLIIANKEENDRDQIEELMNDFNVWVTDIKTLDDNRRFLFQLGKILNKENLADQFNQKITQIFDGIHKPNKPAAYLIWQNPYMTVGQDTFIHHIMQSAGFENISGNQKRYPVIDISALKPAEFIMLSTEPYPFNENHRKALEELLPDSKILLVDGEAFSWYGTHLTKMKNYFTELLKGL